MNVSPTELTGVLVVQPQIFRDDRGAFQEIWNARRYRDAGIDAEFVQDNRSISVRGTLRGLHYQVQQPQGKLVQALSGTIFDVAVDLRRHSPTFGKWVGRELDAESGTQIYVPPGFAHGFYVISESAEVLYKCTDFYAPEYERTLLWNDLDVGIEWPLAGEPLLSDKDQAGYPLSDAEVFSDV